MTQSIQHVGGIITAKEQLEAGRREGGGAAFNLTESRFTFGTEQIRNELYL